MLRGSAPLLAAAAALLLLAPSAQGADYVGLGDSYSSGTGTAGSYSDNCQRTTAAYPSLLDAQIDGSGVNLSCSGGRTQHITTDAQSPGNPVAQLAVAGAVNSGTDVITLQIGGNDAGFVDTLTACANPFTSCSDAIEEAEQKALTELPPQLNAVYDAVRAAGPNATIAVVGYPRIFRPNNTCNVVFSSGEVNDLNAAADLLNTTAKALVQARNLAYVDPRQAFIGHGACDNAEWINGVSATFENSYHPNSTGHSSGFGPVVRSALQAIPETAITTGPPAQSNTADPQFQFSSAPAASSFQCKLDGGAFAACSSPKQYTGLSEGSHTLRVRGVNATGNVDQFPATHTWNVDTVAPALGLSPSGPTGTVSSDTAAFDFTAEGGAAVTCRIDGGSFEPCSSPRQYSGLADGPHTFTVRATDAAGNATTASRAWTADTTAPQATVNSGPGDPTSSEEASLAFSLDDGAGSAECRLIALSEEEGDWDDFAPCASPKLYSGLAEDDYRFEVRGRDGVGNLGSVSAYEWTVDLTAATVTVTSGPPALTNQDAAELEWSFDEPGSTVVCSLDGGAAEPCESPASYEGLQDGEHTFTVQATDPAQNVATDSYSWTVDTAAPPATIDTGPPAVTAEASAQIEFSSEDNGADLECRLDSNLPEDFEPCTSPQGLSGLGDGPHKFEVRAIDEAGNTGPAAAHLWTVDTAGPTTSIDSAPAPPGGSVAQNTAEFGFSASESGSTFECRVGSGDFQPCASPQDYTGLGDGTHTFEVRATDPVGNAGPVTSRQWSVDTTPPTVTFDGGPDQIVASNQADFLFHSSEPGSTFQCRLDSGQPEQFFACVSPRHYGGLSDGPHTLEVRAIDQLGNTGPIAAYSWNADTVTPTLTLGPNPAGGAHVSSDEATFTFSASEPGDFQCRIDAQGPGDPYEVCASPQTYEDLDEGQHTVDVRFTDAGGRSVTQSRTWTVDTVAPTITLSGGPVGTVTSSTAQIGYSVTDGGAPECSYNSAPFAPCGPSPVSRSNLPDGLHELRFRSTDPAGNVGTATREWRVDRTAPQTTIGGGPSGTVMSTDATFDFSSDDPSAGFQCSFDGSLFEACESPRAYAGLARGDHSFRVRAVDPVGNVDTSPAARTWRVEPPSSGTAGAMKKKKARKCRKGKGKKRKGARKCRRRG